MEINITAEKVGTVAKTTAVQTGKAGALGVGTMVTMGLTTGGLAAAGVVAAPLIGGVAGAAALGLGVKALWGKKKEKNNG